MVSRMRTHHPISITLVGMVVDMDTEDTVEEVVIITREVDMVRVVVEVAVVEDTTTVVVVVEEDGTTTTTTITITTITTIIIIMVTTTTIVSIRQDTTHRREATVDMEDNRHTIWDMIITFIQRGVRGVIQPWIHTA